MHTGMDTHTPPPRTLTQAVTQTAAVDRTHIRHKHGQPPSISYSLADRDRRSLVQAHTCTHARTHARTHVRALRSQAHTHLCMPQVLAWSRSMSLCVCPPPFPHHHNLTRSLVR